MSAVDKCPFFKCPAFQLQDGGGPVITTIKTVWKHAGLPNPPKQFVEWIPGQTPLSTNKTVLVAVVTYLAVIFGGRELMRNRQPFKLKFLFQLHNVFLSSGSLLLLALILEQIVPLYWKHGFYWSICNPAAFTKTLTTYYIINYYFKYIELIDTVFLVLKKKPLAFLHVFHHSATAVLCYTQLEGETSVQWVVIGLNLWVHVIMYYYYYATAGGAKIWWKKYLTTLQITQFVIDLFIVYYCTTNHFFFKWGINLPWVTDCTGGEGAAVFGCGLLTSYLFLFIAFYRNTYKKGAAAKAAKAGAAKSK
ncbi:Putative elongation of fatty acids protein 1 [Vanrija pseudolonga]|uniref:Elongation of fatty acids protein n=1 Tax=Vanrija pseudolonga TaxID=143232 RepID=A0AAF0YJG1_9TREE|nr:Putative elongation of fatty acids protein 1 [Vanrija pseudolonga]